MPADLARVQDLFLVAADRPPERPAFLEEACGGDTDRRRRVETLRLSPEPDPSDLNPGRWAAEEIVFKSGLPREQYELALQWYQRTEPGFLTAVEPALALYRLGRYREALAILHRPERDAAARVCAGFMTPFALLELSPTLLPPDELRTRAIALVRFHQGEAGPASVLVARAREENASHYQADEWHGHQGVRATFLYEAA
jgi:hypothetical protein